MPKAKYDFSGYATRNGIKCSDGRIILRDAFKDQDGQKVPLVWQHRHNEPSNVLGHAILENREDGVYCYGKFNDTPSAKDAKELITHGDITSLSIYANNLKEQAKKVIHGCIREVSLVLAGANPGALIDNISFMHGDEMIVDDSEALIYSGITLTLEEELCHSDEEENADDVLDTLTPEQKKAVSKILAHANKKTDEGEEDEESDGIEHADDDVTIKEVFDTLDDKQKKVVYYLISAALGDSAEAAKHSNIDDKGDSDMKKNVFDQANQDTPKNVLTHDQITSILKEAKRIGSLKESFLAHAEEYGFNPIDVLFPDAKDVEGGAPQVIKREDAWVEDVLSSTNHTPFARIRTKVADITADEARAKGYVTGNLKKDEVITLMKRSTTPTTIYKKQKLDRDDLLDITDFDVVMWLKREMRSMLNEEIARAVLISDGRNMSDEDKINEQNVRPIAMDDDNVFVHRVEIANSATVSEIIDEIIRARKHYKGSGTPAFYVGTDLLTEMLLLKDTLGHRIYKTVQELASVLRVSRIVEVEPMNEAVRMVGDEERPILGIIVNLKDYTIGSDKGGQVAMFDDFDIDYNQHKYLIETRISGALTKPKSALVLERLPEE